MFRDRLLWAARRLIDHAPQNCMNPGGKAPSYVDDRFDPLRPVGR